MTRQSYLRWCACGLVACALLSGCRRRDPYTDGYLEITRAEKMDLEDQIYDLEAKLDEKERELEAIRARRPLGTTPGTRERTTPRPPPGAMDDTELMPPMIEPGELMEPKIELPPVEAVPKSSRPATRSLKPVSAEVPAEDFSPPQIATAVDEALVPPDVDAEALAFRQPPASAAPEDTRVAELFINPFHTTGVELDQQPGDDGLVVHFEPRNAAGQFVPQAGEVTIVLVDPAAEGDVARVARWELAKTEVGRRMLDTRPERGIRLKLKWPEERPAHNRLKLFVRYETPEGEKLEASSDLFVTLPGEVSERWTPRQ
jgi:hypothetical protein